VRIGGVYLVVILENGSNLSVSNLVRKAARLHSVYECVLETAASEDDGREEMLA